MSYATVAQFRVYMPQVTVAQASNEVVQEILDRATERIDTKLGFSFTVAGDPSEQVVYGDGTDFLKPPVFVAGSVTLVEAPTGYTVPDYIEQEGLLVVVRGDALLKGSYYTREGLWGYSLAYPYAGGWVAGVPYTVSASFGYSAVPADIVECCLEIAVRIWRARDAGFSDVVGVEGGGAVGYNGALPAFVRDTLEDYRRRYHTPGVY